MAEEESRENSFRENDSMDVKEMRRIAAEAIVEASEYAAMMSVSAVDLGIEISASFFLNIRDAMFHFKALCDYAEAGNDEKAVKNYNNLMEHINRGEKDAVIRLIQQAVAAVTSIIQLNAFDSSDWEGDAAQLQQYMHLLKGKLLCIRSSGIGIARGEEVSIRDEWTETVRYILTIDKICKEHGMTLF